MGRLHLPALGLPATGRTAMGLPAMGRPAWGLPALVLGSTLVASCARGELEGPPPPPTDLEARRVGAAVEISFRVPSDEAIVAAALLRWPAGARVEDPPRDALLVPARPIGGGLVLAVGEATSFVDVSADRCQGHVYRAYAIDRDGRRSDPSPEAVVPSREGIAPPGEAPRVLEAEAVAAGVRLSWSAPPTPTDHVRVVRSSERIEGPESGRVVAEARRARTAVDPWSALQPDETVRYAAFACDACGACAPGGTEITFQTPASLEEAPTDLSVEVEGAIVRARVRPPAAGWDRLAWLAREGVPVEGPEDAVAAWLADGPASEVEIPTISFEPDLPGAPRTYHFAVFACQGEVCLPAAATATRAFTLLEALRGGGHVIVLAHAAADQCRDHTELGTADETASPGWWESCERDCEVATARQLGEDGLTAASLLGEQLAALDLPLGRALASEYCRATESAARVAGVGQREVERRPELSPFVHGDPRCELVRLLPAGAALGDPRANALVVGHEEILGPCLGEGALAPLEGLVLRPDGGGFRLLARLGPEDWEGLP